MREARSKGATHANLQRELELQCPRCSTVAILVPLDDGTTELRPEPTGEQAELALAVAKLTYIGAMRGQRIVIDDQVFLEAGPPAPGWEVPEGASWMPQA